MVRLYVISHFRFYVTNIVQSILSREQLSIFDTKTMTNQTKKLIERSRVCHNHKPQPTLDTYLHKSSFRQW